MTTTTYTEGLHAGEFLLSEGEGQISRDSVTIDASAAALVPGTVLGKITASGKYAPYNAANADGTQTALCIAWDNVPDSTGDQKATVISRYAEVAGTLLTGLDAAGTTQLAAVGIIVR